MQSSSNPSSPPYQLIDFGNGRKLESFGGILVDRPCPAATNRPASPSLWASAKLIYQSTNESLGKWVPRASDSTQDAWTLSIQPTLNTSLQLLVKPQSSGQLGLYPEHWQQWPWFEHQFEPWRWNPLAEPQHPAAPRVLHLFASTGATTLALAAMQAEVTHVDAMRSAVEWARENCRASSMESLPIRWIVDDARKYVERELKRKKEYELILLDPPSYGHGTEGQPWSIQRDLVPLLQACTDLLSKRSIGLVLTGHSPDIQLKELRRAVEDPAKKQRFERFETVQAALIDRAGRTLDCGYVARFLTVLPTGSQVEG